MEFDRIRVMEHLAVDCEASVEEVCALLQREFRLPAFEFDSENETEWGWSEYEGIEYNVSRPYERGKLEEWDGSVPVGCTIGITLMVSRDCLPRRDSQWSSVVLVPQVAQTVADILGRCVYHHRSRDESGHSVIHKRTFQPKSRRA